MTLDELLQELRSRRVLAITHRDSEDESYQLRLSGDGPVITEMMTPEFIAALKVYQAEIFFKIQLNLVEACIDPDTHRSTYRTTKTFADETVFCCDACAELRRQALANLPAKPIATLDFRPGRSDNTQRP